jgi:hypothetical protein
VRAGFKPAHTCNESIIKIDIAAMKTAMQLLIFELFQRERIIIELIFLT